MLLGALSLHPRGPAMRSPRHQVAAVGQHQELPRASSAAPPQRATSHASRPRVFTSACRSGKRIHDIRDTVAVRFSGDEGRTWTAARVIELSGLPPGMRFPFDPTIIPLPDGRVRLYFTSLRGRTFDQSTPAIYSAVSPDGVHYTAEPGVRFGVEGRTVIDCAVVLHQGVFHLFVPTNDPPSSGVGYHATSADGLRFTHVPDVRVAGGRWLGCALSDGEIITFFGTADAPPRLAPGVARPVGGLWVARSRDGQAWEKSSAPAIPGADPGAVALPAGGWLITVTGPPLR